MSDSEIEKLITKIIEERLKGGVAYGIGNSAQLEDVNNIAIIDIPKLQNILKEIIKQKLRENGNNLKEIENDQNFKITVGSIKTQLDNNRIANNIKIYNNTITVPFILKAKLQNGKITERTIGTKENGQQYTQEEIKILIKQAEFGRKSNITRNSGRCDKFTFLSMIVDMDDKSIGKNTKNPIRFITPDNEYKNKTYEEICNVVKQAKQDPNSPNILLIPYSANGHIVTLLVDKEGVHISETGEISFDKNSIMCFDSSHYFTSNFKSTEKPTAGSYIRLGAKYISDHHIVAPMLLLTIGVISMEVTTGVVGTIISSVAIGYGGISTQMCSNILTSNFSNTYFSNELYNCMVKKPINNKIIQGLQGTCSFYTEAFCYLVSKYIQDKTDEGVDLNLNDISDYVNTKGFIKALKDKEEEFFKQYKATMEEVQQTQQLVSRAQNITINQQTPQQTPNTSTLTVTEGVSNTSQFSPHSITPSKTSSTQSISSSSSSTTEHSQTPQQQTPTQSQNDKSTQTQSGTSPLVGGIQKIVGTTLANSEITLTEGSYMSTTSQVSGTTSLSRSSSPLIGSSSNN